MRNIIKIAYFEVLHILKDPILSAIVFIAPLAYAILIGSVYYSALLNNIPLAVVDLDNSSLSREIEISFSESPYFRVVEDIDSHAEFEEAMKIGKVRAGIIIPENLQKDASLHRSSEVLTIYDASNLIWGYNIRKKALEIVTQFSSENTASYLAGQGLSRCEIEKTMNSVDYNISVWYNPMANYNNYLFMGIVMMILHQLGLLSVGLTVTREKEKNTWSQYLTSIIPGFQIVLGKCLPYLIMNFFNYSILLWLSFEFMHAKIEGSIFLIILLGILYDIIITCAGFYISLKAANSLQITRILTLLSVPLLLLSGLTWPSSYMAPAAAALGKILPYTWMANGFRELTIKNLGIGEISGFIVVMSVMALITIALCLTFDKKQKPFIDNGVTINKGCMYPRRRKTLGA